MTITQPRQPEFAKLETKSLGLVWIMCPYPTLLLGLEQVLKAEGHVHGVPEVTDEGPPSIVILCSSGEKLTSKIRYLRARAQGAPILVFGAGADLPLARAALEAGARGFVHMGMQSAQIVRALRLACEGELVVPRELMTGLVGHASPKLSALTARQREILELVAEGLTNAQIAERLFLSEYTVKQHLFAAYKLLGARNRVEAANIFRHNRGFWDS
jgi:DNA-binding NarL/FixJ family response regulator